MACFIVIHDNGWDALNLKNNKRKENESSRYIHMCYADV
jgi:hypothetical protein